MFQKDKALTGSQEQQQPNKLTVDSTLRHLDRPVQTCSCTMVVRDLLFIYMDAFTLSMSDLLNSSLAISLASLETVSGAAAAIVLLIIV